MKKLLNLFRLFRRWREHRELEAAWLENERWNRENDPEAYYSHARASAAAVTWNQEHRS